MKTQNNTEVIELNNNNVVDTDIMEWLIENDKFPAEEENNEDLAEMEASLFDDLEKESFTIEAEPMVYGLPLGEFVRRTEKELDEAKELFNKYSNYTYKKSKKSIEMEHGFVSLNKIHANRVKRALMYQEDINRLERELLAVQNIKKESRVYFV